MRALRHQNIDTPYEVLVIGQDRYGQITEDKLVRFIHTTQPASPAAARNIGIHAAQGEILIFIDADCIPPGDWLVQLASHYDQPEVHVVGGGVEFSKDNFWTFCDNLSTFYEYLATLQPGTRFQLPSLNLSIRKTALEKVGLFDERYPLPAGEDADLTTRLHLAGYQLHFDPQAKVLHLPTRSSLAALLTHAYNFGRYSIKVDQRYQDDLDIPPILRHWTTTLVFAPLLAAGVIYRMARLGALNRRNIQSFPVVFAAKVAWCVGAAYTLRKGSPFV